MGEMDEYVQKISARIDAVEQSMKNATGMIHELALRVGISAQTLSQERSHVQAQFEDAEAKLDDMIKRSRLVVAAFGDCVHEKEFNRAELRVNAFKGEQFVTRAEFDRMLEDLEVD